MCGRIVCLGDSITEGVGDERGIGWVGRIASQLAGQRGNDMPWRMINLGVAGDTSIDIKHRLCSEVLYRTPDMLIIAAGINDTAYKIWPDQRGQKVDFNNARFTWRESFNILKGYNFPILIIGPTPIDEDKMPGLWRPQDDLDKGTNLYNSSIAEYNAMLKEETQRAGHDYLDLFTALNNDEGFMSSLDDGLHPNQSGYDLMAQQIKEKLHHFVNQISTAA